METRVKRFVSHLDSVESFNPTYIFVPLGSKEVIMFCPFSPCDQIFFTSIWWFSFVIYGIYFLAFTYENVSVLSYHFYLPIILLFLNPQVHDLTTRLNRIEVITWLPVLQTQLPVALPITRTLSRAWSIRTHPSFEVPVSTLLHKTLNPAGASTGLVSLRWSPRLKRLKESNF